MKNSPFLNDDGSINDAVRKLALLAGEITPANERMKNFLDRVQGIKNLVSNPEGVYAKNIDDNQRQAVQHGIDMIMTNFNLHFAKEINEAQEKTADTDQ